LRLSLEDHVLLQKSDPRPDEADMFRGSLNQISSIEVVGHGGKMPIWKRYGFAWITGGFFLISLAGHWLFGWFAYISEQQAHQQPIEVSQYTIQMLRDTLENWQSEFLQLLWQVAGLALLLHVGSPQSKEGDDRMEAKIDAILLAVEPKKAGSMLEEIDRDYAGRHTDARYVQKLKKKNN
jgi:hypothetical protein